MGFIYKIVHMESGRAYVGQTERKVETRWQEHCSRSARRSHFDRAVKLYGSQAFTVSVLEEVDNALLNEREIYWIAELRTFTDPNVGFNTTPGGDFVPRQKGRKRSEETRKRISESKKGRSWGRHSEGLKKVFSDMKKGIPLSESHKKALSEAWKLRPPKTQEAREKSRQSMLGKNSRRYLITTPEGEIVIAENGLQSFCRDRGLSMSVMSALNAVACGRRPSYKAWKIEKMEESNETQAYC